ncbi:MAG: DHHA1 domain-containing protein [Desulfurococcales archaeon]|nr:DHHA1 domain-containing protein [Desulfurococcales archaeon]MEB3845854.1 DHHA1 domain-containing protein [Desulfurococcales archaeon]
MLYIFTHTDLDGVGSAAVYLVLNGKKPQDPDVLVTYVEPYNIHEKLEPFIQYLEDEDKIVISDIGINTKIYGELVKTLENAVGKVAAIEWYDHHRWDKEWVENLTELGIKLHVDTGTCATGVVYKYAPKGSDLTAEARNMLDDLVNAVCAADLWLWNHHLAPKLFRIVTLNGSQGDERRNLVLKKLSELNLWDEELEELLKEYVNIELKNYSRIDKRIVRSCRNNCCVASTIKVRGPPTNSFVGSYILSRTNADIACIVKENGSISLRSKKVNVQRIAYNLGGGGHPKAAGAKVELSFLDRLLLKVYTRGFLKRVNRKILDIALSENVC